MAAPFAGYAELSLLLGTPEASSQADARDPRAPKRSRDAVTAIRVPFESAIAIERATGEPVDPAALARAFRDGLLPSAEALALGRASSSGRLAGGGPGGTWTTAVEAPVEDIQAATVELSSGASHAGLVVLGIIATIVLIAVSIEHEKQKSPSCDSPTVYNLGAMGVRVTSRPFDRHRGCFVGDAPAVADVWPGPAMEGPAVALAGLDATP
jgi:hypothetical protein